MNRDDLLRLLDLAGKEAPPGQTDELLLSGPEEQKAPTSASPTALELDEWGVRKGRETLEQSERLQVLQLNEHAVADFHGAAFLPEPTLLPDCVDPRRRQFLEQLFETPEFHALHQSTQLREVPSCLAACAFAEQFALLHQEAERPGREKEESTSAMATLRAVGRALAEASREVEEADEIAQALGMGPGAPGSNDPGAIAALYRRVRSNPVLRRICTLAGRYRRVAQSRQRQKVTHGLDDLVGVTLAGDLARLLPVELARLTLPDLELDTLRRLVERQCMAREYQALEPVGRGPIVVVVDESGSMAGEKVHTAKALALALAWIARQQRRWCALCAYSGSTGERLLTLPPGRWDEQALADWLCAFLGHGSNLDLPIREMPGYHRRLGAPAGKTDLIFLTDALVRIPAELKESFNGWKRQVQARLISLVLGSAPGDLAQISDECHQVQTLSVTEEAVERLLSL